MGSRSTSTPLRLPWLLLPLLTACGGQGDAPFWGFQHASVTVEGEGISGYQIWEFYSERWQRKQKEKHHSCSVVQTLVGTLGDVELDGCLDCGVVYDIELSLLESDCETSLSDRADLAGMTHLGIGVLSDELESQSPHPDAALGWYQSWDGESAEPNGYAWQEPEPTAAVWQDGTFTLWPAVAWQLD